MSHPKTIPFISSFRPLALAVSLAVGSMSVPVHAMTFTSADGDLRFTFDTIFSVGAIVRTQHPDKRNVGIVNGGTSRSVNEDMGNLNYERGEVVSLALKGLHDLDISYGKTGFFTRFGYVSDLAARNKDELSAMAHKRMDFDMELFDAYVRHEFDIGGRRLNVRLGNQVVSWGESTFILGGINVINPIDTVRFRTPGSELKEAFIPVPMLFASQQITDDITLEAFYQFKFEPFKIDPSGSFFSTTDVLGPGGREAFTGFGRTPDRETASRPTGQTMDEPAATSSIARGEDRLARDDGQFGLALRWFMPFLNNTEIGLYALNYHSRTPLASGIKANDPTSTPVLPLPIPLPLPLPRGLTSTEGGSVFAEYPEDIQLYGLSFNTPGPLGIALQGEYSYRPNQPLQKSTVELNLAILGAPNQAGFGSDVEGGANNPGANAYLRGYESVPMHQFQFTALKAFPNLLGASQLIGIFEAAYVHLDLPNDILFNGPGVYLPGESRSPNGGLLGPSFTYPTPLLANGSAQGRNQGYATRNSWGYRAVGRLEYNDVFAGINLFPRFVFSHDVKGVSPFLTEDVKAISIGLNATYNQVWSADIAYTTFFGGREFSGEDCTQPLALPVVGGLPILGDLLGGVGNTVLSGDNLCQLPALTTLPQEPRTYKSIANPNIDRDFVAASISYAF